VPTSQTSSSTPTSGNKPNSLRHVAKLAEVSVATASRVLSGSSHPVSESTRQRVLSAADRLNFEPNRLARALVTARSQTVGVIVHDISDPYFGDIVKGLEDGIHGEEYRLFVASSDRDPERELNYVRAFDAHRVDAIVFAASSFTEPKYATTLQSVVARFRSRGGIVVMLSDHLLSGPRVEFDNRRTVVEMVGYLAGRGHRRIGFIGGPAELEVSRVRLAGFNEAVATLGLDDDPKYRTMGDFTVGGGEKAVIELLANTPDLTAILAANDLMAIGATRQLLASGLDVPGDVSVAGIDDIAIAEYGPIPLTTMHVPTYEIGRKGAELLLSALEEGDPENVQLTGWVVERASVADSPST